MPLSSGDAVGQARVAAFAQGLQRSGWTIGRNVQMDTRWAAADADRIRSDAAELVADCTVVLALGSKASDDPIASITTIAILLDPAAP
jgi:hypothetical protein